MARMYTGIWGSISVQLKYTQPRHFEHLTRDGTTTVWQLARDGHSLPIKALGEITTLVYVMFVYVLHSFNGSFFFFFLFFFHTSTDRFTHSFVPCLSSSVLGRPIILLRFRTDPQKVGRRTEKACQRTEERVDVRVGVCVLLPTPPNHRLRDSGILLCLKLQAICLPLPYSLHISKSYFLFFHILLLLRFRKFSSFSLHSTYSDIYCTAWLHGVPCKVALIPSTFLVSAN